MAIRAFYNGIKGLKVRELPGYLMPRLTVKNLKDSVYQVLHNYSEKYIQTGSMTPIFHVCFYGMAFSYLIALPEERRHMAHKLEKEEKKQAKALAQAQKLEVEEKEKKQSAQMAHKLAEEEEKQAHKLEEEEKEQNQEEEGRFVYHEKELESEEGLLELYERWRSRYKVSRSQADERTRFNSFKETAKIVQKAHSEGKTFVGFNVLADMSHEELTTYCGGGGILTQSRIPRTTPRVHQCVHQCLAKTSSER